MRISRAQVKKNQFSHEEKENLRNLLKRFEKRKLRSEELRVLQAVCSHDFAVLEHQTKQEKKLLKEKHDFKKQIFNSSALGSKRNSMDKLRK